MRGLFRELAAAKLRQRDRQEELTFQAFQTVRVWAITKSKKGRMPKFDTLLPKANDEMSTAEMRAAMTLVAQRYGNRVRVSTRRAN